MSCPRSRERGYASHRKRGERTARRSTHATPRRIASIPLSGLLRQPFPCSTLAAMRGNRPNKHDEAESNAVLIGILLSLILVWVVIHLTPTK